MKVRALISFAGIVTMVKDEELEIKDKEVYEDLINAGYVEDAKKKKVRTNEN